MVTLSDPSNNERSLTIAARSFQLQERNCLEFPLRPATSATRSMLIAIETLYVIYVITVTPVKVETQFLSFRS